MATLLTDLDRTLTDETFVVAPEIRERLAQLRAAGVRTVLITGRTLEYLLEHGLQESFDALVAENGCIACLPRGETLETHGTQLPDAARAALGPLADRIAWGRILGSAPRELAEPISRALDAAMVPHALIYNANEVMILPRGIDKAFGAQRALALLEASGDTTWAIGDGENDVPMLQLANVSGAPANAHPAARAAAQIQLPAHHGAGFLLFTEALLRTAKSGTADAGGAIAPT